METIKQIILRIDKMTIEEIGQLYVSANKMDLDGTEEFEKLEQGDLVNLIIWRIIQKKSMEALNETYKQLNIKPFDVVKGESDYSCPIDLDKLDKLIEQIRT